MIYKTDTYYAEFSYPLDSLQSDILVFLYEPLIGRNAYSLYMTLFTEAKRMERFHRECPLLRLLTYTDLTIDEFEECIKRLEGIGLIKTYQKESVYLYRLRSPLSLKSFFKNQLLTTLLQRTLGKDEYNKTINYFRLAGENTKDYKEITSSFKDVYSIHLSEKRPLTSNGSFLTYKEGNPTIDYDLSLFYESLSDYQIPLKILEPSLNYIKQLAVVYSIDNIALVNIVRESIVENKFDRKIFKEKCIAFYSIDSTSKLTEVYHTQPISQQSEMGQDKLSRHLHYLETVSPYQLLKNKMGGQEPIFHDLSIAETLMTQLGLSPGVVNVLIEYVLGNNDNKLSRSYCETIGASWRRKRITTVKEAYEAARGLHIEKEEVPQEEVETITFEDEGDKEALLERLRKLGE